MKKYCKECGNPIGAEDTFCQHCGSKQDPLLKLAIKNL